MNAILVLWLPILLSAVLVFIASSLIHMVFKWHNSDYRGLPNEDAVRAALRAGTNPPGQYVLPYCGDMKAMATDDMQQKYREGPVGLLTLQANGPFNMGGALVRWFLFNVLIAAIAAVVAVQVLGIAGSANRAAHLIGMLSFLSYSGGSVQAAIWMGKPWSVVAKDLLDGLIYGTITALTFQALWP